MINPDFITNYERTVAELQEFLMFCIVVAGKQAWVMSRKLDGFMIDLFMASGIELPFEAMDDVDDNGLLMQLLVSNKLGNYRKLYRCFKEIIRADLDLRGCTVEELEEIHGIGPKTARYFVLHSREEAEVACLDTHILRWLRWQGHDAPFSTPTGKKYQELERQFIQEAAKRDMTIAELDLKIWVESRRPTPKPWIKHGAGVE